MATAFGAINLYELMEDQLSSITEIAEKHINGFYYVENVDPSTLSKKSVPLDTVYPAQNVEARITIMSIFRKDLFVSITLPVCVVVCGAYAFTWSSFTRVDDANRSILQSVHEQGKLQAVSAEQIGSLKKVQEDSNSKLETISGQLGQIATSLEIMKSNQKISPGA